MSIAKRKVRIYGRVMTMKAMGAGKHNWKLEFTDPGALPCELEEVVNFIDDRSCTVVKSVEIAADGSITVVVLPSRLRIGAHEILALVAIRLQKTNSVEPGTARNRQVPYVNRRGQIAASR
jgi:hypothetical protein